MNRIKLMSAIGASIVAISMNYADVDAASKMAKVNATSLNFRTGPGTTYKSISSIKQGTTVEVLGYTGDWAKIKYSNVTGYVSKKYITEISTTTPTPTQPTSPTTVTKMTVTASSLNVRSTAGTTSKAIGTLTKGKVVEVVERLSNGWAKIKYGSGYGYVSASYLKAVTTTPVPTPPQPTNPTPPPTSTTPVTVTKMTVTASSLNVRSGGAATYKAIGTLTKGKEVEVVEKLSNGWAKIKYGSGYGYVSASYLKAITTTPVPTPPQPTNPTPPPTPTTPVTVTKMTVTASSLNVRSGGAATYSSIGTLTLGKEVEVVEKLSNGWCKIKYGTGYGYVSGSYLKAVTTTPTPTPNPGTIVVKYVNSSTLNIRNNPSGTVIGSFLYGDRVEVVESLSNGWSKIKYNNGYAYVSSSYLSTSVGQRPLPVPNATPAIADPGENDKPTIAVDIGHNVRYNTGAVYGVYKEDYLTKIVGEKVMYKLRSLGYHVVSTVPQSATSNTDALKQRTDTAKANGADIFVSVHFNIGKGYGTEVFYSSEGNAKTIGSNIASNISALGFNNRGVKYGEYLTNQQNGLYVLNQTSIPAVLVEGFFLDSSDVDKFIDMGPSGYDKIADAIVNGLIK